MNKNDSNNTSIPTAEDVIKFLKSRGVPVSKQELAKEFKIQGKEDRREFKDLLRALVKSKDIVKEKGRNYSAEAAFPTNIRVRVESYDDGRSFFNAVPLDEPIEGIKYIHILEKDRPKARIGDCFVARILNVVKGKARVKPLKLIYPELERLVGVVHETKNGFAVTPTNRRIKDSFLLTGDDAKGLKDGDLVVVKANQGGPAQLLENLGHSGDIKNITLIAVHENDIRTEFSEDCIKQAEKAEIPPLKDRTDLRNLNLVTIDGEDARDFDDAVFVEPDTHPSNQGGYKIWVAIADVSYYVNTGSPLDKEALKRGNSTYFPDRVVPMLPERLSNGLCSLNPDEDRGCMALEMCIDTNGNLRRRVIHRGLMRSKARLTYTKVQNYVDGEDVPDIKPVQKDIDNLYKAYKILRTAREKRGALDIHGTEQKIIMNEKGEIIDVAKRIQMPAHQMIEELMVLSNVAVAELLEERNAPCIYRVHESPSYEKIDTLRSFLGGFGYNVPKSNDVESVQLNNILRSSHGKPEEFIVNETVLRSQSQARYDEKNDGHFGLALERYAHFTSPIRRYADLIVHRSLIRAYNLGKDGLRDEEVAALSSIAEQISDRERQSVRAERDAMNRLTALYLSEQEEQIFEGVIAGVADAGLFVRLDQYGAEGFIPIRTLPDDFYIYDEKIQSLVGRRTKRIYQLMATLKVRLVDIDPLLNNIIFEVADNNSAQLAGFEFKFRGRGRVGSNQKRDDKKKGGRNKGRKKNKHKKARSNNKGGSKGKNKS